MKLQEPTSPHPPPPPSGDLQGEVFEGDAHITSVHHKDLILFTSCAAKFLPSKPSSRQESQTRILA